MTLSTQLGVVSSTLPGVLHIVFEEIPLPPSFPAMSRGQGRQLCDEHLNWHLSLPHLALKLVCILLD
jgi:hypothetical protein